MTRVLVLTPYPYGTVAGPRSSFELWEPVLAEAGITLDYAVFETDRLHQIIYEPVGAASKTLEMARSYIRYLPSVRSAADYDAVLVNREAALVGPAILERWVARMGKPIIYQLDDPLYVPYRSTTNGVLSYLKFFSKVATICRLSSVVIANSSYHVAFAQEHNRNVWHIPSLVDGNTFRPGTDLRSPDGAVCFGWTGSLTTISNLNTIREPLRKIAARDDACLRFVGAERFDLGNVPHEALPWNADTEVDDIRSFDVGLLPVPDTPWNHRKFFLKLVQYMAVGIPTIATPLGSNTEVLEPGTTGLFATSDGDWLEAMEYLIAHPDRRIAMGRRAAEIAQERYTLQARAEEIIAAFRSATQPRFRSISRTSGATEDEEKISVVVTVRNDRDGLRELLPCLVAQTLKPDEIVIIDGGSIDGTLDTLNGFSMPGTPIRVTVAPGANIAAGRNVGVRLARNDRIACTDAGCRPEPGWLAALDDALNDADIVGGVFVADGETELERIVSLTHYPVPYELDRPGPLIRLSHRLFGRQYLASQAGCRSMGFHRSVWRAVGGFPEIQYAGEDQAFARTVVDGRFTAALARHAVVHWRPPGSWAANARMFYRYCRGDVRSKGRSRHVLRLLAWSAAPTAFIRGRWPTRAVIAAGAAGYMALPVRRAHVAALRPTTWWRIPAAVAVKDLSQIAGAVRGTVDAIQRIPQPTPQPPPGITVEAAGDKTDGVREFGANRSGSPQH